MTTIVKTARLDRHRHCQYKKSDFWNLVKTMIGNRQFLLPVALLSVIACGSDSTAPKAGSGDSTDDTSSATAGGGGAASGDAGKGVASLDASARPVLDSGPKAASDAGVRSGDAGSPSAVADGTAPTGDSAFLACKQALKKPCNYDDKEIACDGLRTPTVPLSDGGIQGNIVLEGGDYGAFVAYNQGKAFANPVSALEDSCELVASTFGEPASTTEDTLNLRGLDLSLYTVFRPACMKEGETYPVITWANGTCGQSGAYAALLAAVASHGFVVIAANSRYTDQGNNEMLRALDFAKADNDDATSLLYHRLDLTKVGAMGHSQGSSATAHAATDPRIKSIILWNGGASGSPAKPFLAVSGDRDIGDPTIADYTSYTNAATQPGAWLYFHQVLVTGGNFTGHLTLMEQPERAVDFTVAWWQYQLQGNAEAKKFFVGTDCALCNKKAELEYGQHGLM